MAAPETSAINRGATKSGACRMAGDGVAIETVGIHIVSTQLSSSDSGDWAVDTELPPLPSIGREEHFGFR